MNDAQRTSLKPRPSFRTAGCGQVQDLRTIQPQTPSDDQHEAQDDEHKLTVC